MRRRLQASKQAAQSDKNVSSRPSSQPGQMLKIYTDDSPGIKMCVVFILVFVAVLYVVILKKYICKTTRTNTLKRSCRCFGGKFDFYCLCFYSTLGAFFIVSFMYFSSTR